jgi:type III secretion protein V
LGLRLGRFQPIFQKTTGSDLDWTAAFEDVVSANSNGGFRVQLSSPQPSVFTDEVLKEMADDVFWEYGLVFHPPVFSVDEGLPASWLRCEWNDLRLPPQPGIPADRVFVNDTVERLRLLSIDGEARRHPVTRAPGAVVDAAASAACRAAGLTTWDAERFTVLVIGAAIRSAAPAQVSRPLAELYLLKLKEYRPELVTQFEHFASIDTLVRVLRGLVAEAVSVRDLSLILHSMLSIRSTCVVDFAKHIVFTRSSTGTYLASTPKTVEQLTADDYLDSVRWDLKHHITHQHSKGQNSVVVYLLDPELEKRLARAGGMTAAEREALFHEVRVEFDTGLPNSPAAVILTIPTVRRRFRKEIEAEFPHAAVLSYQDLSPEVSIQPIARISPDFSEDQAEIEEDEEIGEE